MLSRRRKPAPITVKAICADLAVYLHQIPPGDTDSVLEAMAAGILAANACGDEAGPALAMLISALGEAWSGIMGRLADQIDLATATEAGSA